MINTESFKMITYQFCGLEILSFGPRLSWLGGVNHSVADLLLSLAPTK